MEEDLVSIIMPTFNGSKFLRGSIEGILSQTYRHWELLITDDKSTETAVRGILDEYARKDKRIRVFYLDGNLGSGGARNNSIREAKGRYIAFCDSDDIWMPQKLQRQIDFLKERNACLTFSSYYLLNDKNVICGLVKAPSKVTLSMLKRDNKIGCSTAVYDTRPYGKFYMPSLRKRQDWALFLNLLKSCGFACSLPEPLVYYRVRSGSVSSRKISLVKYNIKVYQEVFNYSKGKAAAYFLLLFLPTYIAKRVRRKLANMRQPQFKMDGEIPIEK